MTGPVLSLEGEAEEEARGTAAGLEGEVCSVRDGQREGTCRLLGQTAGESRVPPSKE